MSEAVRTLRFSQSGDSLPSDVGWKQAQQRLSTLRMNIRTRGHDKWIINPESSRTLRWWDLTTASCMIFVCFVAPYEVAFQGQRRSLGVLFWVNRVVDFIFSIDIVLQFFIMYPIRSTHGIIYIGKRRLIAKRYLRTWFIVDVISILPFDIVGATIQSQTLSKLAVLRIVRLVRLLKLVQLVRGLRIIKRWELEVGFSYRKMTLLKLFVVVVIGAHWFACFLGILSTLQGDFCYGDNEPAGCVETWVTAEATAMVEGGYAMESWRVYTMALHEAATFIVHPHSSPPTGDLERICFIVIIFIGGFIWTRVIAQSTAVTTSMNRHAIAYHSLMDDLNSSCAELKLPPVVRRRLREFFMKSATESQHAAWKEIVGRMSPLLQTEVTYHIHKDWLSRVSYLKNTPKLFTSRLSMLLRTASYAAQELLGELFTMHVLNHGVCSKAAGRICVITKGKVWGEDHLMLSAYWLLAPNTAYALTYVQVLNLSQHDFQATLHDFPEVQPTMRRYVVWYVFVRGIVYESKRRRHYRARTVDSNVSAMTEGSQYQHKSEAEAIRVALERQENHRQRHKQGAKVLKELIVGTAFVRDVHLRDGMPISTPSPELKASESALELVADRFTQPATIQVSPPTLAEEGCSSRQPRANSSTKLVPLAEPHTPRTVFESLEGRPVPQERVAIGPLKAISADEAKLEQMEKRIMGVLSELSFNVLKQLENLQHRVGSLEHAVKQHSVLGQAPEAISMGIPTTVAPGAISSRQRMVLSSKVNASPER